MSFFNSKSKVFIAMQGPMLRTLSFATLLAGLVAPLVGCGDEQFVKMQHEGDRLIFSQHWSFFILFVVIGLALVALGVPMLTGRITSKGKSRLAGLLLIVLGLIFSVGPLLTAPYSYVALDRERIFIQGGLFGSSQTSVDLTNVKAIDIHQVRRSSGSRKKRRRRRIMKVEFIPHRGQALTINMSGNTRAAALEHLLEIAPELGIEVTDRRD